MTIQIPSRLQDFVRSAVNSGAFRSEEEVVSEALYLLQEREQERQAVLAGIAQADAGQVIEEHVLFDRLEKKAAARLAELGE